ncbi:MAG: UDP-N-acetylmuramate dehydrogenase [Erysipelotrichaceae bacterium]|nr:UDP-N-acetylmuramate dehydrogenase [Erysipelotrichaceae bacterium]
MNREVVNFLSTHGELRTDASFRDITTIRIGGPIDYLVSPYDTDRLLLILRYLREKEIPYKILGNGSNLVCGEAPFHGCVIRMNLMNGYTFHDGVIEVEAGASAVRLARVLAAQGLSGLEFASGIPGCIGGLIYMNAGAYKRCMQDITEEVHVLQGDQDVWLKKEELGFAYRTSVFQQHRNWIILGGKLKVEVSDRESVLKLIDDRLQRRKETQPLDKPSAGSCFRNPEGDFAWRLIDGVGMRGYQLNGIRVSEKHPNFILNVGSATADDFLTVTEMIIDKVEETYGVRLHREVELFNC